MGFGNRKHGGDFGGGDGHGDLMITPLLDLFVALIPFLILSVVLVKINVVDVGVSKPVTVLKKSPNKFQLQVKVSSEEAKVLLNGKNVKSVKVDKDGAWSKEFHQFIVEVKKDHLDELEIFFEPTSDNVKLELIMALIDEARNLRDTDEVLSKKDESGRLVKLKYLFPKVVLRGVYQS
ncbi:MAG: biopolymer transporter ExbD [Proteobacteria bacterium]|nr:biopolymer transporter ExbD [Pseudomonadota bacterium]